MRTFHALALALLVAAPAGAQLSAPRDTIDEPIDVTHYTIELELPETGRVISGTTTLTLRRLAPLDTLVLDLVGFDVRAVTVAGREAGFTRTPATLRIALPPDVADPLRVAVTYSGEVTDGLIIRTDTLGRWTAFGDNWPDRARHWFPSHDRPSDKATVTWAVRAPRGRTVVANGTKVEERLVLKVSKAPDPATPRVLTRWRETRPIPTYTMVIAAAPLAAIELGQTACGRAALARCVPQTVYVRPELASTMPGPFADAGAVVSYFAQLVAPFPYEKLAHVQSSTVFGGMENASAIFYDGRLFERGAMSTGLIAHETAHQWFGDAVTERAWPHLWLSEGFATYFAALWTEHARGADAFRGEMRAMREAVLRDSISVPRRPVVDTTNVPTVALLDVNSYEKGGFVLHMLRRLVGDSAFFRGVREYYLNNRNTNALTDDLRASLERSSGRELGWFFDQWLRRPGYPELTTSWRYDQATGRITLDIAQAARFGAYRFPLTVEVVDGAGMRHRVQVEVPAQPRASIVLPQSFAAARQIVLDPDGDLLASFIES